MKSPQARVACALTLAFSLLAAPPDNIDAQAARNTEPYSCKVGGRIYDPKPASIVIDAQSGRILHAMAANEHRHPASLAKIMTLSLIFDALEAGQISENEAVTVHLTPAIEATRGNSRSTWLPEGTQITVKEAIEAIAIGSANNVSVLMAERLAGSEGAFVNRMNEKARLLGMTKTNFTNPHGLPDKRQVTTAADMARLSLHILREHKSYYDIFDKARARFAGRSKVNHNELARDFSHIDGIKTGYICDSGYNLVASATENGKRVISVVFGGRTPYKRNKLSKELLENALDKLQSTQGEERKDLAYRNYLPKLKIPERPG